MLRGVELDDSDVGHAGTRKRQSEGLFDHLVPIDKAACGAGFNWWTDEEDGRHKR